MASINDLATAAIASSSPATAGAKAGEDGNRGAFVILEGLDRSGKTTQVKLLEQRLIEEGKPVKVMRFPGECSLIVHACDWEMSSKICIALDRSVNTNWADDRLLPQERR
jgi:dTMP kinase